MKKTKVKPNTIPECGPGNPADAGPCPEFCRCCMNMMRKRTRHFVRTCYGKWVCVPCRLGPAGIPIEVDGRYYLEVVGPEPDPTRCDARDG